MNTLYLVLRMVICPKAIMKTRYSSETIRNDASPPYSVDEVSYELVPSRARCVPLAPTLGLLTDVTIRRIQTLIAR